jgi:hypothetical protein
LELALIQLGIRARSRTFFYDESDLDQAMILLNQIFHYQRVDCTTLVNVISTHINDKGWEQRFCHDDSVKLVPNYDIDENLKKLQVLAGSANDAYNDNIVMIAAQLDKAIIMLRLLFILELDDEEDEDELEEDEDDELDDEEEDELDDDEL